MRCDKRREWRVPGFRQKLGSQAVLLLRRVVFRRSLFYGVFWIGGGHGWRRRRHCTFGIEQVVVARAQAEFDQGAGIGSCFRLPAAVLLIALHGGLRGAVPCAGGLAV